MPGASGGAGVAAQQILDTIYEAGIDPAGWPQALAGTARFCRASSAVVVLRDRRTDGVAFAMDYGLPTSYRGSYIRTFRQSDLRLQDLLRQPVGAIRTDTMMPDYDAYRSSAAYRQLYAPLGTEHAMGGFLTEEDGVAVAVRVFRSAQHGAFATPELRRFGQLAPHLARAIRLARRQEQAAAVEALLCRVLDLGNLAVGIVDAAGLPLAANAAGRAMLAGIAPGVRIRLVRTAHAGEAEASTLVPLAGGGAAQVLPLRADDAARFGSAGTVAAIVRPDDGGIDFALERARRAHGFTAAEARLVRALCAGDRLDEAAARFGIGRETVRTQLRQAFQKTGTHRQADLVRLVLLGL